MNAKETVLQALESSLQSFFDGGNATNQIAAKKIKRFRENNLKISTLDTPSINIIDVGESIPEVSDGTNVRYLLVVHVYALVKTDSKSGMLEDINDVISDIQKFCDTNQITDCLDVKLRSVESVNYPDQNMADAAIVLHLRYLRAIGGV